jgi:hypothetical protein
MQYYPPLIYLLKKKYFHEIKISNYLKNFSRNIKIFLIIINSIHTLYILFVFVKLALVNLFINKLRIFTVYKLHFCNFKFLIKIQ